MSRAEAGRSPRSRKPSTPKHALELVQRALCRAGPDDELPDGRLLWQTKEKEARRILEALSEADPEELRAALGSPRSAD